VTHVQSIAFFVAGFVFDMVMLGRIDSWHVIGQQVVYLAVIALLLARMLREEGAPPPVAATRLASWYFKYRGAAVNFCLGTLLNVYTIFFFKSSSLLVSFGFMAALVVLLVANELPRAKFLGLSLKFALLALCFLCFFACVIPVFVGSVGLLVFLLSMAAGSLPLIAIGLWAGRAGPEAFTRVRRQVFVPAGLVLTFFLGFYLFKLVPPVPLAVPFIGVYHSVERDGPGYWLQHERPAWRWWHNGDQDFRAQPGDKVYVFFRVFSPARFSDQVQMRWYWKDPARGWTLQDSIPIRIVGGREQGFRGYGLKSNYQPGEWKVEVETTDEREIGRIYFDVTESPLERREFDVDVQ